VFSATRAACCILWSQSQSCTAISTGRSGLDLAVETGSSAEAARPSEAPRGPRPGRARCKAAAAAPAEAGARFLLQFVLHSSHRAEFLSDFSTISSSAWRWVYPFSLSRRRHCRRWTWWERIGRWKTMPTRRDLNGRAILVDVQVADAHRAVTRAIGWSRAYGSGSARRCFCRTRGRSARGMVAGMFR